MSDYTISMPTLILGSGSPARARILKELGLRFTIDPADIDEESYQAESTDLLVQLLALEKAKVVSARHPQAMILTADTLIIEPGKHTENIIGKPRNEAHAIEILSSLSGHTHKVITGLCLYNPILPENERFIVASEMTLVTFKELTPAVIKQYVITGEPMGKAGAYAIQGKGRALVDNIVGREDNVVGMPVTLLKQILKM